MASSPEAEAAEASRNAGLRVWIEKRNLASLPLAASCFSANIFASGSVRFSAGAALIASSSGFSAASSAAVEEAPTILSRPTMSPPTEPTVPEILTPPV
jgi:hypothetical protein